jgi:hypothetical protein
MLCKIIASIAAKLGITEGQAFILYSVTNVGLGKSGLILAMAILGKLVTKHGLSDSAYEPSYAKQLVGKGILHEFEAKVLDGEATPEAAPEDYRAFGNGLGTISNIPSSGMQPKPGKSRKARATRSTKTSNSGNPRTGRSNRRGKLLAKGSPQGTRKVRVRELLAANVDPKPQIRGPVRRVQLPAYVGSSPGADG